MDSHESAPDELPKEGAASLPRAHQWAQGLILAVLFAAPALLCAYYAPIVESDDWWHIRTGEWILQNHAVPWTDPFSAFGAGKPWAAYSWLFDLLLTQLFQRLGLVGILTYTSGMIVAVTMVMHRLIRRLQEDFSLGVMLTFIASFSLLRIDVARPWMFTILFFAFEMDVLLQARKTGKTRELLWLPIVFAFWANFHIQFIDGLIVLTIALTEAVLAHWWTGLRRGIHAGWLFGVSIACVMATLVNPYGWTIYKSAYELASQPGVLYKVDEMMAMPFRGLPDWGVLFLTVAAAGVLARSRRFLFFESVLFVFALVVSFRAERDLWVVVIAASAILASGLKGDDKNRFGLTLYAAPLVAVATGLIVLLGFRLTHRDNLHLQATLAGEAPVNAVEVAKERGLRGPLFNDYIWGGYLMWSLRMPVSIDGRSALHGDSQMERFDATWWARPGWCSDPDLLRAHLVIGQVTAPLTQVLRMDPRFDLVYEDKLAAVFVAHNPPSSGPAGPLPAERGACAPTTPRK
jgi:hypothetical protein